MGKFIAFLWFILTFARYVNNKSRNFQFSKNNFLSSCVFATENSLLSSNVPKNFVTFVLQFQRNSSCLSRFYSFPLRFHLIFFNVSVFCVTKHTKNEKLSAGGAHKSQANFNEFIGDAKISLSSPCYLISTVCIKML